MAKVSMTFSKLDRGQVSIWNVGRGPIDDKPSHTSAAASRLLPIAHELPLLGVPSERADARRNRRRILEAAAEVVAERGLGEVTMEEVAHRAGVAKGTVFHRFRTRAGLAVALVDESERRLQEAILRGPPPLGPGAEPQERLVAFLDALVDLTESNLGLLLISDYDAPGERYRTGAYGAWRLHVARLLGEAGIDDPRGGLPHSLLAPLAADLVAFRLREDGASSAELKREAARLAIAICRSTTPS
jgi:AcrR family transcriptional regulator